MNALGRLLAVGSEWGGYATLVPTGGARKAARAAADEASEQLGRQGARQASRELKPVVIGEDMERVRKKLYASLSPDPEVGDLYRNLDEAFQRFHKALRGLPPPDYCSVELIKAQASLHQIFFQKYGSLIVGYVKHRFGVSS